MFSPAEKQRYAGKVASLPAVGTLSIWEKLDLVPPVQVRLMARTRARNPVALSDQEIAEASGLMVSEVASYGCSLLWDGIPLEKARQFMQGCQMDLSDAVVWNIATQYLYRNSPKWAHLVRSPDWVGKYKPLKQALDDAIEFSTNQLSRV